VLTLILSNSAVSVTADIHRQRQRLSDKKQKSSVLHLYSDKTANGTEYAL